VGYYDPAQSKTIFSARDIKLHVKSPNPPAGPKTRLLKTPPALPHNQRSVPASQPGAATTLSATSRRSARVAPIHERAGVTAILQPGVHFAEQTSRHPH